MAFGIKDWKNSPDTTTPLSAAGIEDLETRLSDYTDAQFFNVKGRVYGATGDGVADDTAEIQAAITAATAAGGGVVYFPPGTYKVTTVNLASNVHLQGFGGATLQQATGQTTPILYHAQTGVDPISDASLLTDCTIRGLKLIGDLTVAAETVRCGIFIGQGRDIRVENCTFTNCYSSAVCIRNALRVWYIDNRVETCAQLAGGRNALDFSGSDFTDTSDHTGIFVAHGNTVKDSATGGICAISEEALNLRATITDNHCEDCGWAGVAVEAGFAQDSIVANNRVLDSAIGVVFLDTESTHGATVVTKNNVISGNYINSGTLATGHSGARPRGIWTDSSNISITGNTIHTWGSGVFLTSNGTTGVRPINVTIADNTIINTQTNTSNREDFVVLNGDNLTVTGNTLAAAASTFNNAGFWVSASTKVNISNNSTYQTGQDGIKIEDSSQVLCANNLIIDPGLMDNGTDGIRVLGSTATNVTIRGNHMEEVAAGARMYYGLNCSATTATRVSAQDNTIIAPTTGYVNNVAKFARLEDNYTDESASVVASVTPALPLGHKVVTITGNTNITTGFSGPTWAGRTITLVFTGTPTVTDGGGSGTGLVKLAGNFVAAGTTNDPDVLSLVHDGTNWHEEGRSAN